ncbi:hypothetical protein, partial [Pseudoalteromonas sp. AC71-MNA-CIBAN-0107]|uniref:hypothetical protein n=1 Tax=Pseudoalteromonas sp. AC71-MNA-CIBAN-0107 TaxID=3140437 RepID=UPI003323FC8C
MRAFTFYNLKPGDVIVPTAVESHVANATLLADWGIERFCCDFSVGSRCARPPYVMGVAVDVLIARISLFCRRKKARLFLVGLSTI